jgi:hypothetical protein
MGELNWRTVLARIGIMAGALCLPAAAGASTRTVLPLGGKVMDENGIIHDGRPDIIQPNNLTACELRHLGGPWSEWPMTPAERKRRMDELEAEVARVRKHCANGTENQLL